MQTPSGARPIGDLKVGDWVFARDEDFNSPTVHRKQIEELYRYEDRATLDVTVTARSGGQSTIRTTPEHPFAIDGAGWVPAGDLAVGMKTIDMDGNLGTITALTDAPGLHTVHNFSVTDDHTYFVSDLAVWVHNSTYGKTEADYISGRVPRYGPNDEKYYVYPELGDDLVSEIKSMDPDWELDLELETFKVFPWGKEKNIYPVYAIEHLLATASDYRDQSPYSYAEELPFYEDPEVRGAQYAVMKSDGSEGTTISEFMMAHLKENARSEMAEMNLVSLTAMSGPLGAFVAAPQIIGADSETVYNVARVAQSAEGLVPGGGRRGGGARAYGRSGMKLNYKQVQENSRVEYQKITARPNVEQIGGIDVGPYRSVRSHHAIQDAAVRDIAGYNKWDAISINLGNGKGSAHSKTYASQRRSGGGTLGAERRIGYRGLRDAGMTKVDAKAVIRRTDQYFESIGANVNTPTRIPDNRRKE